MKFRELLFHTCGVHAPHTPDIKMITYKILKKDIENRLMELHAGTRCWKIILEINLKGRR
jgi:hypothetical protein